VGGPEGYAEFLDAIGDPAHPRHAELRDWLGRRYDADEFDADRASILLRRLT
jgi:hypothetical protein